MPTHLLVRFAAPWLAMLASVCGGCASTSTADFSRSELNIATCNLEHLAERNGEGCRPRDDADYAVLREHAARLEADVIAFQEVESAAAAARVFPPQEWSIVMSDRPGTARDGFCRGEAGPRILKQDVGFAIRNGVPFTRNPDLQELGLGNPDLRWGVDVTANLPRPLRVLSEHLKSGCNTGRNPADADCPVIFAQAPVLENWIDARATAGEDFAVLGDWNRRTAVAGDEILAIISDDDPPESRLVVAEGWRKAECIARYRDFIDHIALGRRAAARMKSGSFVKYPYGGAEELFPSDHCPQRVTVSTR